MTAAHYTLLFIAVIMALEAAWAIATPLAMRERAKSLLEETHAGVGVWRFFFWGLALLMWLIAWHGNQWAHRALFFIGIFFMTAGFLAQRSGFMESWYNFFLGRRSATGIRLIYAGELLLAAAFAWMAVQGL